MRLHSVKQWYDGYLINDLHIYNPNSVYQAMVEHTLDSYWKNTSSFSTINDFINLNMEGLQEDILHMLSGGKTDVDTGNFQNDLSNIKSKDDVLTALIHLGYLGYDAFEGVAYIPNFEVSKAFQSALQESGWDDIAKSISRCDELLKATIRKDEKKVAELVELAHDSYASILEYNDENSLSCAIRIAYFTAPAYYGIAKEFPSGKGYADMVFIPRKNAGTRPAIVVELKYNKSVLSAIDQIKNRGYVRNLVGFSNEILLVGISYEKDSPDKKHSCIIESFYQS